MSSHQFQEDFEKLPAKLTTDATKMIEGNLSAFYSKGFPAVNVWMVVSFIAKMQYHEVGITSQWTIVYLASLFLSSLIDMEMQVKFVTEKITWRWMIAYLSTILRISAATALMLFFNTTDTVIVFVLYGLVLVLVIYFFCRMFRPQKIPGLRWPVYKDFLDRGFQMSALVVAPSVVGLSGKVLGCVQGSTNLAGGHTALAPECLLFYSAVSGLLAVLFSTVPPFLRQTTHMRRMAEEWIPGIAKIALVLLVVATIVAAEKILQEFVYLLCILIAILAVFLYMCDAEDLLPCLPTRYRAAQQSLNDEREYQAKLSKCLCTAVSPILLAIMAIHSSYGIGSGSTVSLSWPWIVFVSSAVCSILSYTVRIFILAQMTDTKRYEISRKFWNVGSFSIMTITAVFAFLVIRLHPDEVKNIF